MAKGLCTPLVIYIILVGISLVLTAIDNSEKDKFSKIITSLLWGLLWGFLMYQLCKAGHEFWAWIILFLPLILFFIFLLLALLGVVSYKM